MKYLVVDGMLGGTGIREKYGSGFLELSELRLSLKLIRQIIIWVEKYESEHYLGFFDVGAVETLDREGIEISWALKRELLEMGEDSKIEYISAATLRKTLLNMIPPFGS